VRFQKAQAGRAGAAQQAKRGGKKPERTVRKSPCRVRQGGHEKVWSRPVRVGYLYLNRPQPYVERISQKISRELEAKLQYS